MSWVLVNTIFYFSLFIKRYVATHGCRHNWLNSIINIVCDYSAFILFLTNLIIGNLCNFSTIGMRVMVVISINYIKQSSGSQIWVGVMAAKKGKVKIEKLDGANFSFWKMQIKDCIKKCINLFQEIDQRAWQMKVDKQALRVIFLTSSWNVAFNIARETTTMDIMAALFKYICMKSCQPQTKLIWWGDCLVCGWHKVH